MRWRCQFIPLLNEELAFILQNRDLAGGRRLLSVVPVAVAAGEMLILSQPSFSTSVIVWMLAGVLAIQATGEFRLAGFLKAFH